MDSKLADFIKDTRAGMVAEEILGNCVHCGFCTATCPTYQLLGDELDGPRGRIYLIKQVLEGKEVTQKTQLHLDRCLTCRSCETTCPSGVKYSQLLDIGRQVVEDKLKRPMRQSMMISLLRRVLPNALLFKMAVKMGLLFKPLMPKNLAKKLPLIQAKSKPWPTAIQTRKMLVLAGCVQPTLAPNINAATARILDKLGITLIEERKAGCCGAVRFHLNAQEKAKDDMRRNIDAWWAHVEAGVEAIIVTASGCGVQVKEYGHILADDPVYAEKAHKISALCKDPAEVILGLNSELQALLLHTKQAQHSNESLGTIAFQSPCTLQHGQKIRGVVEGLLQSAGFTLTPVADAHLCCGSAGTYSIMQPELSEQLRSNKLKALLAAQPAQIATANIGCMSHLQGGTTTPVRHWVEILDEVLG